MGMLFKAYLSGPKIWSCERCAAHLACHDDIISKAFRGKHGPAYLFHNVVNIALGEKAERELMTGMHTVVDIHCNVCANALGWKYLKAYEEKEQYKEGKYIVERAKMVKDNAWS